jgi:hypothetical protein
MESTAMSYHLTAIEREKVSQSDRYRPALRFITLIGAARVNGLGRPIGPFLDGYDSIHPRANKNFHRRNRFVNCVARLLPSFAGRWDFVKFAVSGKRK